MLRIAEDVVDSAAFHDPAVIKDDDFLGDIGYDAEIMRDHQHRHSELGLQILEQFENIRLDRHVEGGCWFVRYQQRGPANQCHCNHRALTQTARQFKCIFVQRFPRFGKADQLKHRFNRVEPLLLADVTMEVKRLADLVPDGMEL